MKGHALVDSAGRIVIEGETAKQAWEWRPKHDNYAAAWHVVVDGVMTLFRVEPITSFEP